MIHKEHQTPEIILKLEALLSRLSKNHPKIPIITDELRMRKAGYQGEKSIDYPLSFLPEKDYHIFHDLRLKTKKHFFQIDTLILTRNMAIIIEVKNISGTIYFDTAFKQLIQIKEGDVEKGYKYPLSQLERQASLFKEWLTLYRLNDIRLATLVVISNPQTVIRSSSTSKSIYQKVIHKEYLPDKINQIEQMHKQIIDQVEVKEIKRIFKSLIKHHIPLKTNVLERYQINKQDILKGVACTSCDFLPLERVKGGWFCPRCKSKDKQAHYQTLLDYSLLIKPTITNSEARDFLKLESIYTANRLLTSLNITYLGSHKNRKYDLTSLKHLK